MMVGTEKCEECREAKKKCLPEIRDWLGKRQKCDNCLSGNRDCGPSKPPIPKSPRPKLSRFLDDADERKVPLPARFDAAIAEASGGSGSSYRTGFQVSHNSNELRSQLRDLDADAIVSTNLQDMIRAMETRCLEFDVRKLTEYYNLTELQLKSSQKTLSRLNVVGHLGDRAREAGELDLADKTYTRMLEIYRKLPLPVNSMIRDMLIKMAFFYWEVGEPLRAESCCGEISKLRESTGKPVFVEPSVWERMAASLSESSKMIYETFRSHHPDLFSPFNVGTSSLKIDEPFPLIQMMINNDFSPGFSYFGVGQLSCPGNIISLQDYSAMNCNGGTMSHVIQNIQKIPDAELTTRDMLRRSPLFVAAFHRQEAVGHALMKRLAQLEKKVTQSQEMNARDIFGQTILGIAILSGCSFSFITAIIKHHAAIDPELSQYSPTPLQAACWTNRVDLVKLLLDQGAKPDRAFPGTKTPAEEARDTKNDKITQLIADRTKRPRKGPTDYDDDDPVNSVNIFNNRTDEKVHLTGECREVMMDVCMQNPQSFQYMR